MVMTTQEFYGSCGVKVWATDKLGNKELGQRRA